jgi:CheY-like chemotaxis protein
VKIFFEGASAHSSDAPTLPGDLLPPVQTRVLIADNLDRSRHAMAKQLRLAGYEVLEARDGYELVAMTAPLILGECTADRPHVLILAAMMPGISGLSILAGVQGSAWTPDVVLLTTFAERARHGERAWAGAASVIDRPFPAERIPKVVARLQPAWTRAKKGNVR